MTQTYFSQKVTSPEAASFNLGNGVNPRKAEDVQEQYVETRQKLVNAIDETSSLLTNLRGFNNDEWVVRYPQFRDERDAKTQALKRSVSFVDDADIVFLDEPKPARPVVARSATVADMDDVDSLEDAKAEQQTGDAKAGDDALLPSNFNILRLDLRVDPHSSSTLVSQLSKASIASLLSTRITSTLSHLSSLRTRVEDTESKILVTGDLNAGKSTFVNALLRREVMPVDQQPCTRGFWEVRDAAVETGGSEQVHLVVRGAKYDINDESTYVRRSIDELDQVLREIDEEEGDEHDESASTTAENNNNSNNNKPQRIIKLYLSSPSALFPPSAESVDSDDDNESTASTLVASNPLSISLIDAPGLNTSSLSTSLLFSLQPSIDVIVFLISASNHFTLSSKEFLFSASQEKAHIFVVVNKFKEIRDKEKCVKRVLDQIKVLSPKTYEERDELVHFVDSGDALVPGSANPSFDDLESSLKSFVFMKRSKSKFLPAKNYLQNVLADIELLARANALVAKNERLRAQAELARTKPVYEGMLRGREELDDELAVVEDSFTSIAERTTKGSLRDALEAVGRGEVPKGLKVQMPEYPGIWGVFDFARDVRASLVKALDESVRAVEENVRGLTVQGVDEVKSLAESHLPADVPRSKRVFMPEAMFRSASAAPSSGSSAKSSKKGRHSTPATSAASASRQPSSRHSIKTTRRTSSSVVVAGGVHGLGIGLVTDLSAPLANNRELTEEKGGLGDVFDLYYHLAALAKSTSSSKDKENAEKNELDDEDDETSTALSLLSLGGAASLSLTMLGSQALGARSLLSTILKIGDFLGNEESRKWVVPVLAVGGVGLGAWVVWELPQTIPRTVGRRVRRDVVRMYGEQKLVRNNRIRSAKKGDEEEAVKEEEEILTFQSYHAARISSETRTVLRLASWDLRERFRSSLEERGKVVKGLEGDVKRAERAENYFIGGEGKQEGVVGRVRAVRKNVVGAGVGGFD